MTGYTILTVLEGGPCDGQTPRWLYQRVASAYLDPEPAPVYVPDPYLQQVGQESNGLYVNALYQYHHNEHRDGGNLAWVYRHLMSTPLRFDQDLLATLQKVADLRKAGEA